MFFRAAASLLPRSGASAKGILWSCAVASSPFLAFQSRGAIPCHAFLCRAVIKMSLHIPTKTSGSVLPSGFPMIAGFILCTRYPLQADPVCLSGGPRNKIVLNRSQVLFSLQFTHLDPRRVQPYDYAERSLDRLLSLFAE